MKKIYSTLLFVFAVFIAFSQQPVNGNKEYTGTATFDTTAIFKSQVRLKSGTDSLVEQFTSGRFVFNYGNQFLSFGSAATNIGNTSNYTIGAGSNFDLHKAGADTVLGTFSGDTLYFDGQHNLAAYVFNPPLNTSSVTGFWKTTGNAGTTPGTNYIGTTDAKNFVIKTNAVEAIRIDTGGNVGIANSTPTNKLQVNGKVYFSRTSTVPFVFKMNDSLGTLLGGFPNMQMISGNEDTIHATVAVDDNLQAIIGSQDDLGGSGVKFNMKFDATVDSRIVLEANDGTNRNKSFIYPNRFEWGADMLPYNTEQYDIGSPDFTWDSLFVNHVTITDGTQGAGKVLTSDATGLASWAASSTTPLDSATIYALTPTLGTQYYCTDCTGNGITGRIVAYIAAAWRRLLFED